MVFYRPNLRSFRLGFDKLLNVSDIKKPAMALAGHGGLGQNLMGFTWGRQWCHQFWERHRQQEQQPVPLHHRQPVRPT